MKTENSMIRILTWIHKNVRPQHVAFLGVFLLVAAFPSWRFFGVDAIGSIIFALGFLLALGGAYLCAFRAEEEADLRSLHRHLAKLNHIYGAAARGERDRFGEATLSASDVFWIFRVLLIPILFLPASLGIFLAKGTPLLFGLGILAFAIYCSFRAFIVIWRTLEMRRRRKAALEDVDNALREQRKLIDNPEEYIEEHLTRRGWSKTRGK
jgi:hypothetical protein